MKINEHSPGASNSIIPKNHSDSHPREKHIVQAVYNSGATMNGRSAELTVTPDNDVIKNSSLRQSYMPTTNQHRLIKQLGLLQSIDSEKRALYQNYLHYGHNPQDHNDILAKLKDLPDSVVLSPTTRATVSELTSAVEVLGSSLLSFAEREALQGVGLDQLKKREALVQRLMSAVALLPKMFYLADDNVWNAEQKRLKEQVINELVSTVLGRFKSADAEIALRRAISSPDRETAEKIKQVIALNRAHAFKPHRKPHRLELSHIKKSSRKARDYLDRYAFELHIEAPASDDMLRAMRQVCDRLDSLMPHLDSGYTRRHPPTAPRRDTQEWISPTGIRLSVPAKKSSKIFCKGIKKTLGQLKARLSNLNRDKPSLEKKPFLELSDEQREVCINARQRVAPLITLADKLHKTAASLKEAVQEAKLKGIVSVPLPTTVEQALATELSLLLDETPVVRLMQAIDSARAMAKQLLDGPQPLKDDSPQTEALSQLQNIIDGYAQEFTRAGEALLKTAEAAEKDLTSPNLTNQLNALETKGSDLSALFSNALEIVMETKLHTPWQWLSKRETDLRLNWQPIATLLSKGKRIYRPNQPAGKDTLLRNTLPLTVLPLLNQVEKLRMQCRQMEAISKLAAKNDITPTDLVDSVATQFPPIDFSCLQESADNLKRLFSDQPVQLYTNGPDQHELLSAEAILLSDVQAIKSAAEHLKDVKSLMLWIPGDATVAKSFARVRDHLDRVRKDIKDVVEAVTGFRLNSYSSEGMIAKDAGEWIAWLQAKWEKKRLSTTIQSQLNGQLDTVVRELSQSFAAKDDPGGKRLHQRIRIATSDARRGEMTWPVTAEELLSQTKTNKEYTLEWAEKRLTYAMIFNLMAYQSLLPMFSINPLKNTVPSLLRPINLLLTPLTSIVTRKEMNKVKPGSQKNYSALDEHRSRIIFQTIFRATSLLVPQLLKTMAASVIAGWGLVNESDYRKGFLSRAVARLPADMFWAGGFAACRLLPTPSVQPQSVLSLTNRQTPQQYPDELRPKLSAEANLLQRMRRNVADMPETGTTTRAATPADIPLALRSVTDNIEHQEMKLMFDDIIADEILYAAAKSDEEQQRLLIAALTRLINYLESVSHLHDPGDILQARQVIRRLWEYVVYLDYPVSLNEMVQELSEKVLPHLADHDKAALILSQLKTHTKDVTIGERLNALLGRATKAMDIEDTEARRRINITCLLEANDLLKTKPGNEELLAKLSLVMSGFDDEESRKIGVEYRYNKLLRGSAKPDVPQINGDEPFKNHEIPQALKSIRGKINNSHIRDLYFTAWKKADGKSIFISSHPEIEKLIVQTKEFSRLINERKNDFTDDTATAGKTLVHQLWLLINCTDIPEELSGEVMLLADEIIPLTARIEDTSDILDTIYGEIDHPKLKDKVGAIVYRLRMAEKNQDDPDLPNKRLQALVDVETRMLPYPEQQLHSRKLRLLINTLQEADSVDENNSASSPLDVIPGSEHIINTLSEDQIRRYAINYIIDSVHNKEIKEVLTTPPNPDSLDLTFIPGSENNRDGLLLLMNIINYLEDNKKTLLTEEWEEGKSVVKKLWFISERYSFPGQYENAMSVLSDRALPFLAENSLVPELQQGIYSIIDDEILKIELENLVAENDKLNLGASYEAGKINNYNSLMRFRNKLHVFMENSEIVHKLDLYLSGLRDDLNRDKFNTLTKNAGQASSLSTQKLSRPVVTVTLTPDPRGAGYPAVEKQLADKLVKGYYGPETTDHSYQAKRAMMTYALSVSNIHADRDLPENWQDEKVFNEFCTGLMSTLDNYIQNKGTGVLDEIAYYFYDGYMIPNTNIYLGKDTDGKAIYKAKNLFSHEDVIQAWKVNFLRSAPPPEIDSKPRKGNILDLLLMAAPVGRIGKLGKPGRPLGRTIYTKFSHTAREGRPSIASKSTNIQFRKKFKSSSSTDKTTSLTKEKNTPSVRHFGVKVYSGNGPGRITDTQHPTTRPVGSANRIGKAEFELDELTRQVNIKTHGAPFLTSAEGLVSGKSLSKQIKGHVNKYHKTVNLSAQEYRINLQSCYSAVGGRFSQGQVVADRLKVRVAAYQGKYSDYDGRPADVNGGRIVKFDPTGTRINQNVNKILSQPVKVAVHIKKQFTQENAET